MTRENPALDSQILYPLKALALLFSIIRPFSGSNGKGQKSLHLADFSPSFDHEVIQVELFILLSAQQVYSTYYPYKRNYVKD